VKSTRGRFFEDFSTGETLRHATPRTITVGDVALYTALYGDRRPLHSADAWAQAVGLPRAPVHDLLTFHVVFGKTVGDVSLNAVANLGYADGRWLRPVYPGDTLAAESVVLGKKEVSSGKAGIVWVRTTGKNQHGDEVLGYTRWVMVEKRTPGAPSGSGDAPQTRAVVPAAELVAPPIDGRRALSEAWAMGAGAAWDDYGPAEKIDHIDGMTIDAADHTMATRLYQNTARVHFDALAMAGSRFGQRLVYGGHVISIAWALAANGLGSALAILALNGGTHAAPSFAGDTIYAWTEVLEKAPIAGRDDVGALRVKLGAGKNAEPREQVLELDLWLALPRR
jgi:2-methylfumaryl-CoA hydratase